MPREIRTQTRNPALVAACLDILDHYASGAEPKTPFQRAVYAALARSDPYRHLGPSDGAFRRDPDAHYGSCLRAAEAGAVCRSFRRPAAQRLPGADPGFAYFDDVGDPIIPDFPTDTRFTLLYTGLYCRDRTGDRLWLGPSDEPYVITVVVSVENGNNVERSETHPVGDTDRHYGDVDDGEWRNGPIAACWSGPLPTIDLSLVSVAMEHDEGDPDAYEDEIRNIVNLAAAIAAYFNIAIGAVVKAVAEDLIKWVIDSEDDEIGTAVEIIAPDRLKLLAANSTLMLKQTREVLRPTGPFTFLKEEVEDQTTLEYHFFTHHDARGEYFATFKVVSDKDPVFEPDTTVDYIGDGQVVANF